MTPPPSLPRSASSGADAWRAISPEMAIRLEKALGSTADTWLRLQANYDLAQVRAKAISIKVTRLAPKVA